MHRWRVTAIAQGVLRMRMPLKIVARGFVDEFDIADGDVAYERTHGGRHIILSHRSKHAMMLYQIRESKFCSYLLIEEIADA
jgi:hypothetical protein